MHMALIPCPECNKAISSTANVCPSCSFRIRKAKRGFFGTIFKWLFILFNLLMVAWMLSYCAEVGQIASVGGFLGMGMLMNVWALGAIILGALAYFTKGKE